MRKVPGARLMACFRRFSKHPIKRRTAEASRAGAFQQSTKHVEAPQTHQEPSNSTETRPKKSLPATRLPIESAYLSAIAWRSGSETGQT